MKTVFEIFGLTYRPTYKTPKGVKIEEKRLALAIHSRSTRLERNQWVAFCDRTKTY